MKLPVVKKQGSTTWNMRINFTQGLNFARMLTCAVIALVVTRTYPEEDFQSD